MYVVCKYESFKTHNDIVNDFVTMHALDAIFATLKSIVDDIVTCGMMALSRVTKIVWQPQRLDLNMGKRSSVLRIQSQQELPFCAFRVRFICNCGAL